MATWRSAASSFCDNGLQTFARVPQRRTYRPAYEYISFARHTDNAINILPGTHRNLASLASASLHSVL